MVHSSDMARAGFGGILSMKFLDQFLGIDIGSGFPSVLRVIIAVPLDEVMYHSSNFLGV